MYGAAGLMPGGRTAGNGGLWEEKQEQVNKR